MNNNKADKFDDDGIDLSRFFALLFKHRILIAIASASMSCCIILFLVITMIIPPAYSPFPNVYKPYSTLLINEDSTTNNFSKLLFQTPNLSNTGISLTKFSSGELAIRIMKSNSILDTIVAEFGITDRYRITTGKKVQSREALLKHLTLENDDKTMTLTVSYEDYDPVFASKLVNRIVEELTSKLDALDIARNARQKEELGSTISEVQNSIAKLEAQTIIYQKKYGFLQVQTLAEEQITTSAQVRIQLLNKEMEIKTKQDLLAIEDPEMKKLFAERDNLKKLAAELEEGFSTYNGDKPSQKDLPVVAQAFNHIQRELSVQEKLYALLLQQYEMMKLPLAGFLPVVQVVDYADVPDYKSGPQRLLLWIIGSLLSVILSVFFVVIRNSIAIFSENFNMKESRKK